MGEGSTDGAISRFAVIPTRGNRPDVLERCLEAIVPQVGHVLIVENSDNFEVSFEQDWIKVSRVLLPMQPPNLSRLWNVGLDWIRDRHARYNRILRWENPKWNVAILNDDAIVPPGWFEAVSHDMRAFDAAAGCSDPDGGLHAPVHHRKIGPVGLDRRLVGYAFILAGEKGVRADEDLHWYFTDDHIDYASREAGGTVMIPGFPVQHLYPNGQMTPELQARVAVDAQNFKDRWGIMPW